MAMLPTKGVIHMKRIVILGAGTAGTIMANRLRRLYRRELRAGQVTITIVDQDDRHVYHPGLLFVPFGTYRSGDIVKPRHKSLPHDIWYVRAAIEDRKSTRL